MAAESEEHSAHGEGRPAAASGGVRPGSMMGLSGSAGGDDEPGWTRPCWPHDCGPGGGPWKKRRRTLLVGVVGRWEEYAVITYFFDPELDNSRKQAFRKAAKVWNSLTCIRFVEAAEKPPPPSVLVDALEKDACYATHIGFPGDDTYTVVNLGWCDSDRYTGNIVHELGHVLGMNHEQKRPDAVHEYHGHGPHIVVHWQNVEKEWVNQYTQDTQSYVGSANDGARDPHSGYAEYDFGSIMHYPAGAHFETVPAESASLTGNRRTLSDGDILQILDQYQCKEKKQQQ